MNLTYKNPITGREIIFYYDPEPGDYPNKFVKVLDRNGSVVEFFDFEKMKRFLNFKYPYIEIKKDAVYSQIKIPTNIPVKVLLRNDITFKKGHIMNEFVVVSCDNQLYMVRPEWLKD